jgi:uncharacterized protein (DUF302 family)
MNTPSAPRQFLATLLLSLTSLLLLAPAANAETREQRGPMVIYSAEGGYEDAIDALKNAITEQGIVISNVLHASDMLNRTGPDLGITENVYLNASTYEFCSSILSHALVGHDPANMMACPYTIGVYQLSKQPDAIHIAYRIPQGVPGSEDTTARIQKLVETIITSALEFL